MRESEARFRRVADSAPVLIWMLTPDARVSYLNRTWLEFTGTQLIDGLGGGWLNSVHPEDRVRCASAEHVGIGPFKVVEYVADQYIRYEPFENYYNGKPLLGEVVYRPYADAVTLAAAIGPKTESA